MHLRSSYGALCGSENALRCPVVLLTDSAPHHFTPEGVSRSAASNWAIAQTNLKKIVKNLVSAAIFGREEALRGPRCFRWDKF